jgi:hypothetical protein
MRLTTIASTKLRKPRLNEDKTFTNMLLTLIGYG